MIGEQTIRSDELSILVTTRNRPDLLPIALRSISSAFRAGTPVLIGDNGNAAVTAELLRSNRNFDLQIVHEANPAGSSYTYNLRRLIELCQTPWFGILHDDDFFVGDSGNIIRRCIREERADLIFSDHWVAHNDGVLDESASIANTRTYRRDRLIPGETGNLALLAVQNSICIDGFFLKTEIARAVEFDLSLPVFGQNKWMIEVCSRCSIGWYIPEKIFAYRITAGSVTSQGLDRVEILEALLKVEIEAGSSRRALKARILRSWWSALKGAVKNRTLVPFLRAYPIVRVLRW